DLTEGRGLRLRHRCALAPHEQELGIEPYPRGFPHRVQGIEGDPSHRLWTSGVQRHPGSGPDLEPSDHAEDTAIGGTGGQEAVLVPEVETIEGADVVAALLRYIETIEERIDLVLRHRDVVGDEPVEE